MATHPRESGGDFTPLPTGIYKARCFIMADLGKQETYYGDKYRVHFRWEVQGERIQVDGKDLPASIGATVTNSSNKESNMRKLLAGWRGRDFTDEEFLEFDLEKVVGTACQLIVKQAKNHKDQTYAYVDSIVHCADSEVPPLENPPQVYLPTTPTDLLRNAPEWIQKAMANRIPDEPAYEEPSPPTGEFDDAIPF